MTNYDKPWDLLCSSMFINVPWTYFTGDIHGFHRVARGNWPEGMLTQVAPTSEASTDLSESDEEIGKLQVWKFRESWLILWWSYDVDCS